MSEQGVPMICATSVMKPGRTRIGRISGDLTLPRTVPIINIVAAAVGAFVGLLLATNLGGGAHAVPLGLGIGASGGWFAVTYSPLKNESLLKWFELKVKTQTRTRYINGRRVILAVGTGIVDGPSSGPVQLLRSAVQVTPGHYDERGAIRSRANRNLADGQTDPTLLWVGTAPAEGAVMLPQEAAVPTSRRSRRSEPASNPTPAAEPAPTGADADFFSGPAQRLAD